MTSQKRLLLSLCFFYLFTFLVITILYLFNPFYNQCILGKCDNDFGIYMFHSGMKYEGGWQNGEKHGEGTLTYPDGSKYVGEWKNNRMHGHGVKTYIDFQMYKYSGEWKEGKRDGWGTLEYKNGSKYTGTWRNGERNGKGSFLHPDGRLIKGTWVNGTMNGQASVMYPDGSMYKGIWKNNQRHGLGVLTYPDGAEIAIEWGKDKIEGSSKFYSIDFAVHYDIHKLCNAIKTDVNLPLNARGNTVEWLNKLLEIPNLYENLNKQQRVTGFSWEINNLLLSSKEWRNKDYLELNSDVQKAIIRLNRLLIEHFYPENTPKVTWSMSVFLG